MELDAVELWFHEDDTQGERIECRRIRDSSNVMELSDKSFLLHFRFSKEVFLYVLNFIKTELKIPCRRTAVPYIIKLSATLKFLATGGFQHQIGVYRHTGLAQQTMSTIISDVCHVIEKIMCPKHINFIMTNNEKKSCKKHCWEKSGILGIIGIVGGTHIQLLRPNKNEHLFFNRKLKHSINAMICDHAMTIRSVNGRYGGASHNSHIWNISKERDFLKRNFEKGDKSSWIIGDSGYPLEPWLLAPYRTALSLNSAESNFNDRFSIARSTIEGTFGVLKGRFRCLLSARDLHCSPQKATRILNVCCALHNICLLYKVEKPTSIQIDPEEDVIPYNTQLVMENLDLSTTARATRDQIRNNLLA